jgi:hypothetical protein
MSYVEILSPDMQVPPKGRKPTQIHNQRQAQPLANFPSYFFLVEIICYRWFRIINRGIQI